MRDESETQDPDAQLALSFAPPSERAALGALLAIWEQLGTIPQRCSDPQVALARLEWWERELERIGGGTAQHPLGRALIAAAGGSCLGQDGRTLVLAVAREIRPDGLADGAELLAHLGGRHGGLVRCALRLRGAPPQASLATRYGALRGRQRLQAGDPQLTALLPRAWRHAGDPGGTALRELTSGFSGNTLIDKDTNDLGPFLGAYLGLASLRAVSARAPGALRRLLVAWRDARRAGRVG